MQNDQPVPDIKLTATELKVLKGLVKFIEKRNNNPDSNEKQDTQFTPREFAESGSDADYTKLEDYVSTKERGEYHRRFFLLFNFHAHVRALKKAGLIKRANPEKERTAIYQLVYSLKQTKAFVDRHDRYGQLKPIQKNAAIRPAELSRAM